LHAELSSDLTKLKDAMEQMQKKEADLVSTELSLLLDDYPFDFHLTFSAWSTGFNSATLRFEGKGDRSHSSFKAGLMIMMMMMMVM
jgi:hypothetical protein